MIIVKDLSVERLDKKYLKISVYLLHLEILQLKRQNGSGKTTL